MKRKGVLVLGLLTSMAQAYKGERCIDAAILSGVRLLQGTSSDTLGKVCTILRITEETLEKVCDIQVTTTGILEKVCDIQVTTTEILEKVCDIQDCTPVPITQPMTITQSGSYCVSQNLTGNGTDPVLTINAQSVCIDLACHVIDGNGANVGVQANSNKVVIRNGCVTNTTEQLIFLNSVDQATIDGVLFQGGDTGITTTDCCDVTVSNCQFRGATSISMDFFTSNLVRIVDCGICESNGTHGIRFTSSNGILIDPTIIQNTNLTTAGIELNGCSGVVMDRVQIGQNGLTTAPTEFTGILGVSTNDVKILTPSIYDLRATTTLRGIDGLDQNDWTIKCGSISDLAITLDGVIDGIRNGEASFIDSCVLARFNTAVGATTVVGITTGTNSRYTNNLLSDFNNDGAGSVMYGFAMFDGVDRVEIYNNTVTNLISDNGSTGAAYFIQGQRAVVNENSAIGNVGTPGLIGFNVLTFGTGNYIFANQANGNTTAFAGTFTAASLTVYDASAGTYTFAPHGLINVEVVV